MTLRELVQRSGLDQATVDNICKNMEEAIEAKNSILRNLKYSLAHAIKAYNDAIRVYEAKLLEFGIPADELGIEPLVTNTSTMPAGLVAAWMCQLQKTPRATKRCLFESLLDYLTCLKNICQIITSNYAPRVFKRCPYLFQLPNRRI